MVFGNNAGILCLLALLLFGCTNLFEPNQTTAQFDAEFDLMNSSGQKVTDFLPTEDIYFEYRITNRTGENLVYLVPDAGPIVTFEIMQGNNRIGSSDDGFAYAQVVTNDSLAANASVAYRYNWLSVRQHDALPEGEYVARAVPRLLFENAATPRTQVIPFEVICTSDCDSLKVVRITDQPRAAIEQDAFRLNSARLRQDVLTLNLSHSGGCKHHDYALYMSPSAFAESSPVQASLYLQHNGNDDMCEAYITTDVSFNIKPLIDLYRRQYGKDEPIRLNIFDFAGNAQSNDLVLQYVPESSDAVLFRTGTFFGMCAGYCRFELRITETDVSYFAFGWRGQPVPDRLLEGKITAVESEKLKSLVDMDALFALQEVIGCPDCADGGGEWVEIATAEHGASIPAIQELLQELRTIRERFHDAMFAGQPGD
jgi:hypothetical protein